MVVVAMGAGLILATAACSSDDDDTTTTDGAAVTAPAATDAAPPDTALLDTASPDTASPDTASPATGTPDTGSPATTDPGTTDAETTTEEIADRADDLRDALADGDFTTMLDLLELSGLSDELEGREVTVLAPTEDAFDSMTVDELTDLASDPDRAEELLRHHILDGLYTYDELAALTEVTTIDGETLPVTVDGDTLTVGGATVTPPAADALAGEDGQEAAVLGIDALLLGDA
jgi:uncharacterized surface protein with fasciclin (FAS1) repeats